MPTPFHQSIRLLTVRLLIYYFFFCSVKFFTCQNFLASSWRLMCSSKSSLKVFGDWTFLTSQISQWGFLHVRLCWRLVINRGKPPRKGGLSSGRDYPRMLEIKTPCCLMGITLLSMLEIIPFSFRSHDSRASCFFTVIAILIVNLDNSLLGVVKIASITHPSSGFRPWICRRPSKIMGVKWYNADFVDSGLCRPYWKLLPLASSKGKQGFWQATIKACPAMIELLLRRVGKL